MSTGTPFRFFPGLKDRPWCVRDTTPGTEMMSLDWNRKHNPILRMTSYEEFKTADETVAKARKRFQNQNGHPRQLFGG